MSAAGPGVVGIGGAAAAASATLAAASRAAIAAATTQSAALLAAGNDDDKRSNATTDASTAGATGGDAVAAMFQLNPGATTGSVDGRSYTPTFQLHANVDSGGDFTQGLSDRVSYLVDNGLNGAKLQVNPPELGPVELRIAVSGGHAQVWMTTHSAATRDALELSSPKLREMLGSHGFGQVSVDVSQRSFQDRSSQSQPYQRMAAVERSTTALPAGSAVAKIVPRASSGNLDAYA